MIGTRTLWAGLVIVLLVPLLGAGGPDPAAELAARELLIERAAAADEALASLERALTPGLDAARSAAARVVGGGELPGDEIHTAAEAVADAAPAAHAARLAIRALEGARRTLAIGSSVEAAVTADELTSVATQLESSATAADAFVRMRIRAEGLVNRLSKALASLDAGSLTDARAEVAAVRADHDALAAWEVGAVTLPVWLETTDAMIAAVENIIGATDAGDEDAALEAANEFAALSEDAAPADRALRIAIGEGGSAVLGAPLGRLADVLRRVAAARVEVASIVQTVGR